MKSLSLLVVPALVCVAAVGAAQQAAPPPAQSNLEAGGLRPPDAVDSTAEAPAEGAESSPEKELAKADEEDSGRGLEWIWLNAEVGGRKLTITHGQLERVLDFNTLTITDRIRAK